ncbi:MAG: macrocin O-methyltransferase [Actinobacteria bacterium]|uniref:Unannotated protein n=1 Tax=freshwater metagenome TaxID=449393 RepID=A0A6J6QGF4_9ZZZZ|nr:macrocin O-methyltransferase [Actinomycetota bacterium]MSX61723.1 macrocin O-methyltransferase [Actinomycetota bacterium]MSZ69250.1 macrocin O-methyltransferase [Actinomycetota bacterium]MTA67089.1 macrocin O-methyltransferase [Actinomycetota bacterium]MTB16049.1 macrocin O-methyltransferase [Actinomycetota bacterium]
MSMLSRIYSVLGRFDMEIHRKVRDKYPIELTNFERDCLSKAKPITMTPAQRFSAIALSMRYLRENRISGDVVECGVWAGGSIGAAALLGAADTEPRHYWLFDTFEGMTRPSINDTQEARKTYEKTRNESTEGSSWCEVNEKQVRDNLVAIGVDLDLCTFITGDVLNTLLSSVLPKKIALLRLDTDWYESTRVELEILFPRLVSGGILIIDDYGHWDGARKAVDEYFMKREIKPLLIPIDYAGRICIKA